MQAAPPSPKLVTMRPPKVLALLALAATLLAAAAPAEAQRGGNRGGGNRGGGRGGSSGGGSTWGALLPPALPPVKTDPFKDFPKSPRAPGAAPDAGAALLPAPVRSALPDGLPEIPELEDDGGPLSLRDPYDPELKREYFEVCDRDANGWISFREARESMELSRDSYRSFDRDLDGRIVRDEFETRYDHVVDRSGAFPPPRAPLQLTLAGGEPGAPVAADASPLLAFDADADGTIDASELETLLAALRLPPGVVTPAAVLDTVDADGSGRVESAELRSAEEGLTLVLNLFGGAGQADLLSLLGGASGAAGATPLFPRRILEPTPHFERLDRDADGFLSGDDLAAIQSPASLPVRANAVVAALDTDGDGRLSPAEFRAAFR